MNDIFENRLRDLLDSYASDSGLSADAIVEAIDAEYGRINPPPSAETQAWARGTTLAREQEAAEYQRRLSAHVAQFGEARPGFKWAEFPGNRFIEVRV